MTMFGRIAVVAAAVVLGAMLAGCGGSGAAGPPNLPDTGGEQSLEIGPLLVRAASAPGFVARDVPYPDAGVTLTAVYGSEITYLAAQALLDRIVFVSGRGGGVSNLWICDLNGDNPVQLTGNTASESHPSWSRDGGAITFERQWPGQDVEIMTINADGSGVRALTNNDLADRHPSFSPEGRRIAFQREYAGGNNEICLVYTNGSGLLNLTLHAAWDGAPDWSPDATDSTILFATDRDIPSEIYEMNDDGSGLTRITDNSASDSAPDYHPYLPRYAAERWLHGNWEIIAGDVVTGGDTDNYSASPGQQHAPCWSSDGRFIAYQSDVGGDWELALQEADLPMDKFALTRNGVRDAHPDLGSPTMQTERVIIGPAGSDWGGADPIWSSCYAGVAAWDETSYLNFVRIGLRPADLGSLSVSPLTHPAQGPSFSPAALLVEADEIVNLREDAGRGREPTVWDLDALNCTAAVLYFGNLDGKLVAVMPLRDTAYPSAAGARDPVARRLEAGALVTEGPFSAVFDAQGHNLAPNGAATVAIDDSATVSVLR